MFDAYDIDQYLQYLLHDAQAQMWDASKRLHAINASYDQICNRVIEAHENYFLYETTLEEMIKLVYRHNQLHYRDMRKSLNH